MPYKQNRLEIPKDIGFAFIEIPSSSGARDMPNLIDDYYFIKIDISILQSNNYVLMLSLCFNSPLRPCSTCVAAFSVLHFKLKNI